jgi:hypothetical protein
MTDLVKPDYGKTDLKTFPEEVRKYVQCDLCERKTWSPVRIEWLDGEGPTITLCHKCWRKMRGLTQPSDVEFVEFSEFVESF